MAFETERNKNERLEQEMEGCRTRYENMKLILSKVETECVSLEKDRRRMNELVGSLCGDVENAHQAIVGAHVKARHVEER